MSCHFSAEISDTADWNTASWQRMASVVSKDNYVGPIVGGIALESGLGQNLVLGDVSLDAVPPSMMAPVPGSPAATRDELALALGRRKIILTAWDETLVGYQQ
jgi:hypothetical protein